MNNAKLDAKDAAGNIVNGGYGGESAIAVGAHMVTGNLTMYGFDKAGQPYTSYEYSIAKGI